jgi:hypothetical protein
MTLLDYKPGTAYIDICRSEFADSRRFDEFCAFMCAPKDSGALRIRIDAQQHGDIIMRNNGSGRTAMTDERANKQLQECGDSNDSGICRYTQTYCDSSYPQFCHLYNLGVKYKKYERGEQP